MARVKDGEQEALLREAEAVPGCHGDKSHCAECVFLALPAITETGIPPEAVCLLTGLGGAALGGMRAHQYSLVVVRPCVDTFDRHGKASLGQ